MKTQYRSEAQETHSQSKAQGNSSLSNSQISERGELRGAGVRYGCVNKYTASIQSFYLL